MLLITGNEDLRLFAAWRQERKAVAAEKAAELPIWDDLEMGRQG